MESAFGVDHGAGVISKLSGYDYKDARGDVVIANRVGRMKTRDAYSPQKARATAVKDVKAREKRSAKTNTTIGAGLGTVVGTGLASAGAKPKTKGALIGAAAGAAAVGGSAMLSDRRRRGSRVQRKTEQYKKPGYDQVWEHRNKRTGETSLRQGFAIDRPMSPSQNWERF